MISHVFISFYALPAFYHFRDGFKLEKVRLAPGAPITCRKELFKLFTYWGNIRNINHQKTKSDKQSKKIVSKGTVLNTPEPCTTSIGTTLGPI